MPHDGHMSGNTTVALGIRDLSGRDLTGQAVMVAVRRAADRSAPPVAVDRRDIDLVGADSPARVYHAAKGMSLDAAQALVSDVARAADRRAHAGLEACLADVQQTGGRVATVALPMDEGPDVGDTPLSEVLASHSLIHAAEAHLYREALVTAAVEQGVTVFRYPVRAQSGMAASSLRLTPAEVSTQLDEWGRQIGRPWRRHHRDAALAGWLALAS